MLRIAHIISPVIVDKTSDLFIAQPITFETMLLAKEFSSHTCQVDLFSATFPEDRSFVPDYYSKTDDLKRSILDLGVFKPDRKLPILKDILDRLYKSSDADYFIYTNVDIALQPHFYATIVKLIESGFDAFVINRRVINKIFNSIEKLPLMMAQLGEPHPGHDCFVFKRDIYPYFFLNNACVGAVFIGKILIWNLAVFSTNFFEFKDLHATFHIGKDIIWSSWSSKEHDDYKSYNHLQAKEVLKELIKKRTNTIELLQKFKILKPESAFNEFLNINYF